MIAGLIPGRRGRAALRAAAALMAALATSAAAQPAPIETMSGDLEAYLVGVPIPGNNTTADVDKYVPPSASERAKFVEALDHFVAGRLQSGANAAAEVNYRTIVYRDTPRGDTKIVLRENETDIKYRGLFAISLSPTRDLIIESPHPLFDGTRAQGINLYIALGARGFMQSGTHRNNSTTVSPCDGTQTNGEPYYISDMAHVVDSFYHMAHERWTTGWPGSLAVSVHGMSTTSANNADADVVMSNGTTGDISVFSNSWSRQVAARMNEIRADAAPRTRSAASHQTAGEVLPLSGGTNTQGRFTNGSPAPCTSGIVNAPLPERFLHMEQSPTVRANPASWGFVTQAYSELFAALAPPTADTPPPLGLVAHWPLNGDGTEAIAARNAALVGGVSATADRALAPAGALLFNGTDGHLAAPDFDYQGAACSFSYTFWFETQTGSNANQYLVSHGSVGAGNALDIPSSLHLYLQSSTGQLRVRFTLEDGRHWLLNAPSPATGLADASWHHGVFTYSFDNGPALYVDGQFVASEPTLSGRCFDPENDIVFGSRTDLTAGRFLGPGRMDDIRIYNRALSLADVVDIFEEDVSSLKGSHWVID